MVTEPMKTTAPSQKLSDIDTNILEFLLKNGPSTESVIKNSPRFPGFRDIEKVTYQVRINRSLKKLHEMFLIDVAQTKKTHGGLTSKTWQINTSGFLISLCAPNYEKVISNVKSFLVDLPIVTSSNKQLFPEGFGLYRAVSEDDKKFVEAILFSFFTYDIGDSLIHDSRSNPDLPLYNFYVKINMERLKIVLPKDPESGEYLDYTGDYSEGDGDLILRKMFLTHLTEINFRLRSTKELRPFEHLVRVLIRNPEAHDYLPKIRRVLEESIGYHRTQSLVKTKHVEFLKAQVPSDILNSKR